MRLVSLFGALSAFSSLAVYALPAAEPLEAALVKRDTCELVSRGHRFFQLLTVNAEGDVSNAQEKRGYGGYPDPVCDDLFLSSPDES